MLFGVIWMGAQAVMPAVIGRAIDRGVAAKDGSQLLFYALLLLLVGLIQAGAGIVRHRFAVTNWLTAAFRIMQITGRHAVGLGASLPRKVSTGELLAIGTSDMSHIGQVMDVSARFAGAVVSFILVAVILLQTSVTLGLVVLIGVPGLMLLIGPLLSPLQRRSAHQRELMGHLSNTASDIVGGLRVLRGIGGEQVFLDRYRRESQAARQAGVKVAGMQSTLDALQIFLPGLFVVVVVWLGARYAVEGRITPGELVAFYGYASFLMMPLGTATEYATKIIRARVSAKRILRVFAHGSDYVATGEIVPMPPEGSVLRDIRSGLVVQPGRFIAIVSETPDDSSYLADRLGRISPEGADEDVTLGGIPLPQLPIEQLRERIVVSDNGAQLFSGPLGAGLDLRGHGDVKMQDAIEAASAYDILLALDEGIETVIDERGRSFSGGQRQRLVLVRALTLDPEILVLVEPASAVDAHTEARIAERLAEYRAGRTTVVTTSSPLLLDAVDEVAFLRDGTIHVVGHHRELLASNPTYRAVVTREVGVEE